MVNDYVHLFVILVYMTMKDTIFMNVVYMYIHFQRTENERLAHNQVNIPTIAVGAHEQKTEDPFPLSWVPDSRLVSRCQTPPLSDNRTAGRSLVSRLIITRVLNVYYCVGRWSVSACMHPHNYLAGNYKFCNGFCSGSAWAANRYHWCSTWLPALRQTEGGHYCLYIRPVRY